LGLCPKPYLLFEKSKAKTLAKNIFKPMFVILRVKPEESKVFY